MNIPKNQQDRFIVLQELYKRKMDNINLEYVDYSTEDFLKAVNLTFEQIELIMDYLTEKGLTSESGESSISQITSYGIDEYERAMSNPEEKTDHFSKYIFTITNSTFHNSPLQQGNVDSIQNVVINENDLEKINELFKSFKNKYDEIKDKLDDTSKLFIDRDLRMIETELKTKKPLVKNIKEKFEMLSLTINTIATTVPFVQEYLVPIISQIIETLLK